MLGLGSRQTRLPAQLGFAVWPKNFFATYTAVVAAGQEGKGELPCGPPLATYSTRTASGLEGAEEEEEGIG